MITLIIIFHFNLLEKRVSIINNINQHHSIQEPILLRSGRQLATFVSDFIDLLNGKRSLELLLVQKFVLKETWVGLLNGFLFALLSALLAYLWFDDRLIAIIMGLAMIANLLFAGVLGTLIPLTLEKFKIDPAISSSVFLTTATDVIGFFTFLGLSAIIIL